METLFHILKQPRPVHGPTVATLCGAEPTHFVHYNGATVFVKEADFFREQGGRTAAWGRTWLPVVASSLGDARREGARIFGVRLSALYADEI